MSLRRWFKSFICTYRPTSARHIGKYIWFEDKDGRRPCKIIAVTSESFVLCPHDSYASEDAEFVDEVDAEVVSDRDLLVYMLER